jgi:hypothetical protein
MISIAANSGEAGGRRMDFAGFTRVVGHEFAIREWQMGAEKYGLETWFGVRCFCGLAESRRGRKWVGGENGSGAKMGQAVPFTHLNDFVVIDRAVMCYIFVAHENDYGPRAAKQLFQGAGLGGQGGRG